MKEVGVVLFLLCSVQCLEKVHSVEVCFGVNTWILTVICPSYQAWMIVLHSSFDTNKRSTIINMFTFYYKYIKDINNEGATPSTNTPLEVRK